MIQCPLHDSVAINLPGKLGHGKQEVGEWVGVRMIYWNIKINFGLALICEYWVFLGKMSLFDIWSGSNVTPAPLLASYSPIDSITTSSYSVHPPIAASKTTQRTGYHPNVSLLSFCRGRNCLQILGHIPGMLILFRNICINNTLEV